jgi:CelD/BcsL family acetyltransferase involved in cellulose biosynthesis
VNAPFALPEAATNPVNAIAEADLPARHFLRAAWFNAGARRATRTVLLRGRDGSAIAALPLAPKAIGPIALWQIAGAYWPMRSATIRADASITELADALADPATHRQLGSVWRMGPVIDADPQLAKFKAAAVQSGWHVLSRHIGTIFSLDLATLTGSGTWPSAKGQQKNRWRVRQLEKTGPVRIEHFTGTDWTAATRDAIAVIEANSWVGKLEQGGDTKFHDPALRAYWEDAAHDPVIAAMIRGSLLYVGDTPAAFTFGLDCGTTRYLIANNFDQRFHKHSPGRVLLYDDFTSAAARGIRHCDWGLGDGGYKREMGAEPVGEASDLLFVRGSIKAALLTRLWER